MNISGVSAQPMMQQPSSTNMKAGGMPPGPPPGGMPPGMESVLSESEISDVKSMLESLSPDQKEALKGALDQLKVEAESNNYSLEDISLGFINALNTITGKNSDSSENNTGLNVSA